MSKTYHSKRDRLARQQGKEHHEHGPDDVCRYCGKSRTGGTKKKESRVLRDALARARHPHEFMNLIDTTMLDESDT